MKTISNSVSVTMALSLTAEQKELLKIFKIEEQYVVPAYQRPYSWEYDQCFQLYNDLMEAFSANEDYFIGNIIIAKSESNKETLEIIDGQQRLITLLLIIKVLHVFQPELKILEQILKQEDWKGVGNKPRIVSEIFEAKDGDDLKEILDSDKNYLDYRLKECSDKSGKIVERKCKSRFETNIFYFYNWIQFYADKGGDIEMFISYLLKNVYLLPIELSGKTQDEANEKALVIFETINNRGMNLEDADIFKAKLFKKAKKINEEHLFIELWIDFKGYCERLNLEIDDVFRYYSHIIRGKEGITTSEINLREFFTRESYSPFELKKYREILDDLFQILEVLEFFNQEKFRNTELGKWIQLVDAYTNQYPKFAVVTYLFENGFNIDNKLITFFKSLVRYVYFQGSTTTVKFEIYTIIKQVSNQQRINEYLKDVSLEFFDYLGRLKYGYTLLAFYLKQETSLNTYNIDKLINLKDKEYLGESWKTVDLDNVIECLGNFIVLDIPKKYLSFDRKMNYYQNSNIEEVKHILLNEFSYDSFKKRDSELKKILIDFFSGKR